jgi:cytochrome P450
MPKIEQMYTYFEEVIEERRRNPGQDLPSHVVNLRIDGDQLRHDELLGFCTVLLLGGIDDSTKLIATALWRLAWDFPLRYRLMYDRNIIPTTIDEFLRYYAPSTIGRLIKEEVSVGGIPMKAGQQVLLMLPVANRDPRTFPYPDTVIADRSPNKHLGFGTGVHRCLGAHILRVEVQIAIEELLTRIPEFELDRTRKAAWPLARLRGWAACRSFSSPENHCIMNPSTAAFWPGWSTRRPTEANFRNSQAVACWGRQIAQTQGLGNRF